MTQLADPTDLDGLRQALKPLDPEGRLKPLGLKRVVISGTAHLEVAAALREALGRPGSASVVILTDKTPILRAGERLSALVERQSTDIVRLTRDVRSTGPGGVVAELALDVGQRIKNVGVVELQVVEHRRARPVVHKLAALVKKRRVVLIRLDDEERLAGWRRVLRR